MIRITYLSHSGFILDLGEKTLVFDYYQGNLREHLRKDQEIIFFASHAHFDHFRQEIFSFAKDYQTTYILSDDIKVEKEENRHFVEPDKDYVFQEIKIRTLKSTDEGVAFCIDTKGYHIFYAGDLNFWKWREEGEAYNKKMEADYQAEIKKIEGEKFDLAFFPLDPRQKEDFYLGFDYFMRNTDTKWVVPMHMWGKYEYIDKLLALDESLAYRNKIIKITKEEQSFSIE